MEEMIRTRVLSKEEKEKFDKNFPFPEPKRTGIRRVEKKKGYTIRYNHGLGKEKFKVYTDIQPTKKYTQGMF